MAPRMFNDSTATFLIMVKVIAAGLVSVVISMDEWKIPTSRLGSPFTGLGRSMNLWSLQWSWTSPLDDLVWTGERFPN